MPGIPEFVREGSKLGHLGHFDVGDPLRNAGGPVGQLRTFDHAS
jgi:hypothetical protein